MRTSKRAFTLIELLIVVAIIAILAAIAVPNFLEAQSRAKISRTKADMRSLSVALQAYRVDYNQYPPDVDGGGYSGLSTPGSEIGSYKMLTTPVAYITTIPRDPFYMGEGRIPSNQGISAKNVNYFEYSEENVYDQSDATRAAATKNAGIGFLLISVGPDRFGDFNWSAANWIAVGRNDPTALGDNSRCICYDPTNGTVSPGDIILSAKGFYGTK